MTDRLYRSRDERIIAESAAALAVAAPVNPVL
jgi:hypothetical protein